MVKGEGDEVVRVADSVSLTSRGLVRSGPARAINSRGSGGQRWRVRRDDRVFVRDESNMDV